MGIAGFSSILKWGVAVVLALSVVPLSVKKSGSVDSEFKQIIETKFDLSGYEISVVKYKVDKTMLNSSIIRTYGFIIKRSGRFVTEFYIQKHFRPEWKNTFEAKNEYTVWALEEEGKKGIKVLKRYPQFSNYVLNFPARDLAISDVKNIVRDRYIRDIILN